MWVMLLLLPMPFLISRCLSPLPPKHHKISRWVGWMLILPCLIGLTVLLMPILAGTSTSMYSLMTILAALACYYIIRGAALIGVNASYYSLGRERGEPFPKVPTILAWALSVLEPLAVITILLLSYFSNWPGAMDVKGWEETKQILLLVLMVGVCLAYGFLFMLNAKGRELSKPQPPPRPSRTGNQPVPGRDPRAGLNASGSRGPSMGSSSRPVSNPASKPPSKGPGTK